MKPNQEKDKVQENSKKLLRKGTSRAHINRKLLKITQAKTTPPPN